MVAYNRVQRTGDRRCRTVIADDHAIVRDATRPLLASIETIEIVGEADNGLAAIALAKRLQPDLLVLDIAMPHASGVVVVGEVQRWSPQTRIAVLTGVRSAGVLGELVASGVAGILSKSASADELRAGFATIVAGGTFVSSEVAAILAANPTLHDLTARERQVLSLALQGMTNAEIGQLLHISRKTADHHRTSLMRKLDVHSAAELAAFALREGLLDLHSS